MSKHLFLTGHLGFIGSHLLPKLIEQGYEVETDMRYLHSRKYDCLIHLAGKNNIKNEFDADLIESNIILTREIFKVPTRIVYASSCVAHYPMNPYAYSKLYAEHLGAIHGNALGLRFHNIYGKNNSKGIVKYLFDQKNGSRIAIRGAGVTRDYVAVEDITDYIISSLDGRVGVEDVGTGVGTYNIDLISLYCKLSGKRFSIEETFPYNSEPPSMISNNAIPHISLEEGLKKMIQG